MMIRGFQRVYAVAACLAMVLAGTALGQDVSAAPPGEARPVWLAGPIEVTQGIQNPGNTVPLIAGRTTWVRAFLSAGTPVGLVRGTLRVRTASGVYTVPSTGPGATVAQGRAPDRRRIDASLNFLLPGGATREDSARLELTEVQSVSAGASLSCVNCDATSAAVTFGPSTVLRVRVIGFGYPWADGWVVPDDTEYAALHSWLARVYPVSAVDFDSITMDGLDLPGACEDVNVRLARIRSLDLAGGQDLRTRYYGMVREARRFFMGGCSLGIPDAPDPSVVASGASGNPLDHREFEWDQDDSFADWYGGHELAHTFGRRHPGWCRQTVDDPQAVRADSGRISPAGSGDLGLDPLTLQVMDRAHAFDLLTYCENKWISARTYTAILQRLREEDALYAPSLLPLVAPPAVSQGAVAAGEEAPDSLLEVFVWFSTLEQNRGRIAAAFTSVRRGRSAAVDEAVIDTTPADRQVLIELAFGTGRIRHPAWIMVARPRGAYAAAGRPVPAVETGEGWVHAYVSSFAGGGWIRVLRNGSVIDSVRKTASRPRLVNLSRGIETVGGKARGYRFEWRYDDPDGPSTQLAVYVQASFDGGVNWRVVEQTQERRLLISCALLRGRASARIRLIASDGVNRAVAYTGDELVQAANDPCRPRP